MEARNNKLTFRVAKLVSHPLIFQNAIHVSPVHNPHHDSPTLNSFFAKFVLESELEIYHPVIFDQMVSEASEVQTSSILRKNLHLSEGDQIELELMDADKLTSSTVKQIALCIRSIKKVSKRLKLSEVKSLFTQYFSAYPLCTGQDLALPYHEGLIVLSVEHIDSQTLAASYQLELTSKIDLSVSPFSDVVLEIDPSSNDPIMRHGLFTATKSISDIDFNLKEVGGHKKELARILLQVFYSRIIPPEMAEAYGVKHVKGVLLYGPPGTGKTHIARSVASMFPKTQVKVISGPELKSKYVGESPENVRNIFYDAREAWRAKGKDSDVYVYIFDEIDSLAPIRGGQTGTHAEDDIVAQLLTELDGVDSPDNIIILGTTNRKDLIDPALLRPGRLEEHIEIALPDETGRLEILSIKSASMNDEKLLDPAVDLKTWAKETKNFTAAELEQLVKKAVHFAMEDNLEVEVGGSFRLKKDIQTVAQLAKVKQAHFYRSFQEILPAFGVDKTCQEFAENVVIYNDEFKHSIDHFLSLLAKVEKNHKLNGFRLLISGEGGVGKTSLAMYLAKLSGVNFVRTITADKVLSLPTAKQLSYFDEELENAKRVPFSIIVLDELESLLSADADLSTYNNLMRLKLEAFLKALSMSKNKCIVLATTKNLAFIQRMRLVGLFNEQDVISKVTLSKLSSEASFKTLSEICEFLGYKITPSSHIMAADERELSLPIRDLVYEIKKFCSDEAHGDCLDIDEFYLSVTLSVSYLSASASGCTQFDSPPLAR